MPWGNGEWGRRAGDQRGGRGEGNKWGTFLSMFVYKHWLERGFEGSEEAERASESQLKTKQMSQD